MVHRWSWHSLSGHLAGIPTEEIVALPMLEGKAMGGPRNGVKLSASVKWDGRLEGHKGKYVWREDGWLWVKDDIEKPMFRASRSKIYDW